MPCGDRAGWQLDQKGCGGACALEVVKTGCCKALMGSVRARPPWLRGLCWEFVEMRLGCHRGPAVPGEVSEGHSSRTCQVLFWG